RARGQGQGKVGELRERTGRRAGRDQDVLGLDVSVGRGHADHPVATAAEPGYGYAGLDASAARPGKFKSEQARLEPAVARAEASIHDIVREVGKTPPRLGSLQQLDIIESPSALGGDQVCLILGTFIGSCD